MKKTIAIILCSIPFTAFSAINQNTTRIVKQPAESTTERNPVAVVKKNPAPGERTKITIVKPTTPPLSGRAKYQVQRPKQKPPLIAGQWTCFSYDTSGERWYSINSHRKHALKKARKSCRRNSHTPHSCHTDSAFCVFGGQQHVRNKPVFH